MNTPFRRSIVTVVALHLLLSACSATAVMPASSTSQTWPEPRPDHHPDTRQTPWPAPAIVRMQPNFQAPSATHCARPIQTREIPGAFQRHERRAPRAYDHEAHKGDTREAVAAESTAKREAAPSASSGAPTAAAAPSSTAPADAIGRREGRSSSAESSADGAIGKRMLTPTLLDRAHRPSQTPQLQDPRLETVTAGVVDDNADFTGYLAFRNRTRVAHRERDIRDRYLLEVKDARGRGVADAEVAAQSPRGPAMWARTDTAGRVWIHPDAFDATRASVYDVAVRKDGRQAQAYLKRGQKSSIEVVLDARTAPVRAQLDMVFLIDATGSMADEIDKLKASVHAIADDVAQLPSRPDLCFGLVAYRDRTDAFLVRTHDFTNDLGAFQGVLNALHAAGGGDYPEAMNEALNETVHKLSWRGNGTTRMVFLIADAPPHLAYGGPQYDDDMVAALGKGIKVFSVGASGLDKQGEYIQRQIAQYTGGRFVFLTYDDARKPASGPGRETVHDVKNYSVDTLDRLIVRLVSDELGKLSRME